MVSATPTAFELRLHAPEIGTVLSCFLLYVCNSNTAHTVDPALRLPGSHCLRVLLWYLVQMNSYRLYGR